MKGERLDISILLKRENYFDLTAFMCLNCLDVSNLQALL